MLKKILEEMLFLEKINVVALIGRDGFVIEIATHQTTDIVALSSFSSYVLEFFEENATLMDKGLVKQMVFEYENGAIILTPASKEELLAVITESSSATGRAIYTIAHTRSRVQAVL
jgi:predicted regulator of Ras-like GTPase activity (Roadblock/LC7/MglB family)